MQKLTEEQLWKSLERSMENTDFENIIDLETLDVINEIFERLTAIFPAFKQAWPTKSHYVESQKEWLKAFKTANISTIEQIKYGLERFRLLESPFVPSPGQFIALCKPSIDSLGVPSVEAAYREACLNSHPTSDRKWSHKVVYHAWLSTGSHELSHLPRSQSFSMFERNYLITLKYFTEGQQLPDIPRAIKHENVTSKTPEIAKEALSSIKNMLGLK